MKKLKGLMLLLKNWNHSIVYVKKPYMKGISEPDIGSYILIFYDDGAVGYWDYNDVDFAAGNFDRVTHFIQLYTPK